MPPDDMDRELSELLDQRRAANPRTTPDREPVGTQSLRKVIALTVAAIVAATVVLAAVILLS